MDAAGDPAVDELVLVWASQTGKTEVLLNAVGFFVAQDPSPILFVLPTITIAEAFSKDRLAPMIRDTPALTDLVHDVRTRDSGNTVLAKTFPGGRIILAGANSPASLASRPIRILIADEVDRYPPSAGTEGDPVELAKKRTSTFWNRRTLLASTPSIKGASRIEKAWESSDQRRYHIACPHCGEFQALVWQQLQWDKAEDGSPENVRYVCVGCQGEIREAEKSAILALGHWVAERPFRGMAGFHLNGLYSPWIRWEELAREFLRAKHEGPETLRVFVNTRLAETWEEGGEVVEPTALFARREQFAAPVPGKVLVLTAGVDVQDDRLELEVVGWGVGEESWGIDKRVLWGDPGKPEVWQMLADALEQSYQHEKGDRYRILSTCIDSGGHHTQIVYGFCRQRQARRVFAIKGKEGRGLPIVSQALRRRTGKRRRPVELFIVGVDDAKRTIYSRLRLTELGSGYCHFPVDQAYDEEYFAQLTAEKLVTRRTARGFSYTVWVKTRPRNEALDCRVYALAALYLLDPSWEALAKRAEARHRERQGTEDVPPKVQKPPVRPPLRPRRRSWINAWR